VPLSFFLHVPEENIWGRGTGRIPFVLANEQRQIIKEDLKPGIVLSPFNARLMKEGDWSCSLYTGFTDKPLTRKYIG